MKKDESAASVLIFAGTTEGRLLAEYASAHQIRCFVSVATDYGKSLISHLDGICIHTGRMNSEDMQKYIKENQIRLVIDATHPFAGIVTQNIKDACRKAAERSDIRYVRCVRSFDYDRFLNMDAQTVYVRSVKDAVEYLKQTTGNILIATGSKELQQYTEISHYEERCYARVLSTCESVEKSVKLGFEGSHLIAMQGPFSVEMNVALLKQTQAAYFVTKETGAAGGFEEKAEAARQAGAVLIVVGRPDEDGENLENVKELIKQYCET